MRKRRNPNRGRAQIPRISRAFGRTFILRAPHCPASGMANPRVCDRLSRNAGVSHKCVGLSCYCSACPWLGLAGAMSELLALYSIGRSTVLFSTITGRLVFDGARISNGSALLFVTVQRTSAFSVHDAAFPLVGLALVGLTPLGAFGPRGVLLLFDLRGCLLPLLAALEPAGGKVALVKVSLIFQAARRIARKIVLLPIQARCPGSVALCSVAEFCSSPRDWFPEIRNR